MRLYIKLSKNKVPVPFNYQHLLTGLVHKWIGADNQEHGQRSLYSFSWLQRTHPVKGGLSLDRDAYFFISAYSTDLIKHILKGVLADAAAFCGSHVVDVHIKEVPEFTEEACFFMNSPILLRKREGAQIKHVTYQDDAFDTLLTESMQNKLKQAGLPCDGISLMLDRGYATPQTKLVDYKGVQNKVTLAPVIIRGTAEQIAFAWQVGLGNSTGIGFGAVR